METDVPEEKKKGERKHMGLTDQIKQYGVEPNTSTLLILAVFISIILGVGIAIGYMLPH